MTETAPKPTQTLIGRRVSLTDRHGGFTLLTERGTLWRAGPKTGTVEAVEAGRFYQSQERVSWLRVRLDRAHGRYTHGQVYLDETTGALLHGARWLEESPAPGTQRQ